MWSSLLAMVLSSLLGHGDGADLQIPKYEGLFPRHMYLVRAKAVSIAQLDDYREQAVWQIEHIYVGGKSRKGQTFATIREQSRPSGTFVETERNMPPFTKGEIGLWWIKWDDKVNRLVPDFNIWDLGHVGWISVTRRKGADPKVYEAWLQWAKWVEEIYDAGPQERITLLKRSCTNKDENIAGAALHFLAHANPPDLKDFVDKLVARNDLPMSMQIRIDYLWYGKKEWLSSKTRGRLLRRWMTSNLGQGSDAREWEEKIRARLGTYLTLHYLDYQTFLGLVILAEANPTRSSEFKRGLFRMAKPLTTEEFEAGFKLLTDRIKTGKAISDQAICARLLGQFAPRNRAQIRVVQSILNQTSAPEVTKPLSELLRDSKARE